MKQAILALALLLAAPLIGLAAPSDKPAPLTGPTTTWDGPAPLASCKALPITEAPQVRSEQDALVTCSSYCGPSQCLGQWAGDPCVLQPGKVGVCTQAAEYCSTDGVKRCFCKWPPPVE